MTYYRHSVIYLCAGLMLLASLIPAAQPASAQPLSQDAPAADFVDVSQAAGITAVHQASWDEYSEERPFTDGYLAVGQAWSDYDNDGWVDLYVTGNEEPNVLYHNQRNGTFAVSPLAESVSLPDVLSGGAVWADFDNDGWRDLYVLVHGANVLFHNEQGQGFTDVTAQAGVGDVGKGTTAAWGDYDGDSFLDLYVANWSCFPKCDPVDFTQAQDRLYHNNGDGTFADVSNLLTYDKLLGSAFSASFVDYDNDGDADLYVVNDKVQNPIGNVLWRNDGADKEGDCGGWCWTDVSAEMGADAIVHGMGLALGDYDNDQDIDFYFTNMVEPNVLLRNQGADGFVDETADAGFVNEPTNTVGWGTAFFDYDNDGWLDLYYAATEFIKFNDLQGPLGMMFPFASRIFHNQGDGQFQDATPADWVDNPRPGMGFAYADYDRDGRVDFVSGQWNQGYHLYRNQTDEDGAVGNNWLTIRLIGGGPVSRDAVGARVFVTRTDGRKLMQEVQIGSALGAGNDTALHFGMGHELVRQVVVVWPSGLKRDYNTLAVNRLWHIAYPTIEDDPIVDQLRLSIPQPFRDVSQQAGITATHRGDWRMFDPTFTTGYLGVGQAWGDYNNDGWPDLFVTGNEDPNVLYHNNGDGTFSLTPFAESLNLPGILSGGAVWGDYDNDGWKDLYVLNHGPNALFHNERGRGFTNVAAAAGVDDAGKGSTATWGDYDNDSFLDLYVTNWACYPECGEPVDFTQSQDRLYHNNSDGTFEDVSDLLVYEKLLGAGFTASFVDYDNDRDVDIYVVNDALMNPVGNVLWRNDGPGCGGWCWTDASASTGAGVVIEGMGLAVGDYDNDMDLDFYFSNMVNPSALMQNQGGKLFTEIAKAAQVEAAHSATVGWGASFLDYNNDGWLDLLLSTTEFRNLDRDTPPDGMLFEHPNFLFRNEQNGAFSNQTPTYWYERPKQSMGLAYADYDRDGWVDFVTGDWSRGYTLYRNQGLEGRANNWLTVRLNGSGPVNRDAVGARAYVRDSNGRTHMQEVISGSSLGAGNDLDLHFGLGDADIEWLMVRWPNGAVRLYQNVPLNQIWRVGYEMGSGDVGK
ncbi:MAG: FG-GAP-like repeat-containing protein [Caldilineaceae bacterium]